MAEEIDNAVQRPIVTEPVKDAIEFHPNRARIRMPEAAVGVREMNQRIAMAVQLYNAVKPVAEHGVRNPNSIVIAESSAKRVMEVEPGVRKMNIGVRKMNIGIPSVCIDDAIEPMDEGGIS